MNISENMTSSEPFDVFLSYNVKDKATVIYLAKKLQDEAHLKVWLADSKVHAGTTSWQRVIEQGLKNSRACAIFIGPHDVGQWQADEIDAARVLNKEQPFFRIVPVLLPGCGSNSVPLFLRSSCIWVDFRSGINDSEAFNRLVDGICGHEMSIADLPSLNYRCPYKGLEAFEEADVEFFFSRDIFVQQILLEHLRHSNFLAVVGPSGSGKSSVIRAGLIPTLCGSKLPLKMPSHILKLTPGVRPLESLAVALQPFIASSSNIELPHLFERLQQSEQGLNQTIIDAVKANSISRVLLFIDQFEEVFTLCTDSGQRMALFNNLAYTATLHGSPLIIVLTMRSDFLGRCSIHSEFNILISENLIQVPQMNNTELRAAIVKPANKVGFRFEDGLVDIILKDTIGAPGDLPLLQHALLELWQRRENGRLLHSTYNEIGGVQGSLARHADEVFSQLTPKQQVLVSKIFVRLTALGEGTEDTRRRVSKAELLALDIEAEIVLRKLADNRLVTTYLDATSKEETVEVVHEALVRGWPKLAQWLNEDRAFHLFRQKLTQDADDWEHHGYDASYLYHGGRLVDAENWSQTRPKDLTSHEKDFITKGSVAQRQLEIEKEVEKIATINAFGVRFAYRVGNLLGTIPINFYAIQKLFKQSDDPHLKALLDLLHEDVKKIESILYAGQSLRKFGSIQKETVNINEILEEVQTQQILPMNINVSMKLDPDVTTLVANNAVLIDIVTNIIDNAIYAMPTGGYLTLSTKLHRENKLVEIRIDDTGCGMLPEVLQRLREPFFTTKRANLGLGVWLCYQAVQEMGGQVIISSEVDRGTSFIIQLPI